MSRKKMLFIYNPKAGKERIRSNLLDLIDIFTKAGYEVTAYPTQGTGDAANVVMERDEKYQMIKCTPVYAADLSGSCSFGKYSADTGLLLYFDKKWRTVWISD